MARMYGLVALGIVTTGATIWVGDAAGVGGRHIRARLDRNLLFFGIIFGTLYAAGASSEEGTSRSALSCTWFFTGMWGLLLSPILTRYTSETIGVAFLLTAGLFVAMSVVGMTTKKDLSKLGRC